VTSRTVWIGVGTSFGVALTVIGIGILPVSSRGAARQVHVPNDLESSTNQREKIK
jgi:hypothetical protein